MRAMGQAEKYSQSPNPRRARLGPPSWRATVGPGACIERRHLRTAVRIAGYTRPFELPSTMHTPGHESRRPYSTCSMQVFIGTMPRDS